MSRGNFEHNYPLVIKFLEKNGYEYTTFDEWGQHLRVIGSTCIIDLWPSRMTYHVIESEWPNDHKWPRLNYWFREKELRNILERT